MNDGPIDSLELFRAGDVVIEAEIFPDTDSSPEDDNYDSDAQRADVVGRWKRSEWRYVGIVVHVEYRGVFIGEDSRWPVAHGVIDAATDVDALEMTADEYQGNVVTMRSPLAGVVVKALANAEKWLTSVAASTAPLQAAWTWADPNGKH